MPYTIYDSAGDQKKTKQGSTSITPGIVKSHCDLLMQGKIQVRLPGAGIDVWARVGQVGAGKNRGLNWFPQPGDEVLVSYNAEDPRDAFVICGLSSLANPMPVSTPLDTMTKRTIRTGLTPALGHVLEFDDALQTITITASLGEEIQLAPTGITIKMNANTKISLQGPPKAGPSVITIEDGISKITMSPAGMSLSSTVPISIKSDTAVMIEGALVKVNGKTLMLNT